MEFINTRTPYDREKSLPIYYNGKPLNTSYRVDFLIQDSLRVELKALKKISSTEQAQVINYLKASKLKMGLILNFGAPSLEVKRLIL